MAATLTMTVRTHHIELSPFPFFVSFSHHHDGSMTRMIPSFDSAALSGRFVLFPVGSKTICFDYCQSKTRLEIVFVIPPRPQHTMSPFPPFFVSAILIAASMTTMRPSFIPKITIFLISSFTAQAKDSNAPRGSSDQD